MTTTRAQRRALALRIQRSLGRDTTSRLTALRARVDAFRFNPNEPRDSHGRWTDGAPGLGGIGGDFNLSDKDHDILSTAVKSLTSKFSGLEADKKKYGGLRDSLASGKTLKSGDIELARNALLKHADFVDHIADQNFFERAHFPMKDRKKRAADARDLSRRLGEHRHPPFTGFNPAGMSSPTLAFKHRFDPHQKRDSHGRWTDTGMGAADSIGKLGDKPHSKDVKKYPGEKNMKVASRDRPQAPPPSKTPFNQPSLDTIEKNLTSKADWEDMGRYNERKIVIGRLKHLLGNDKAKGEQLARLRALTRRIDGWEMEAGREPVFMPRSHYKK